MQDELSTLMSERLHLEQPTPKQQPMPHEPQSPGPVMYISQHYHHSSHKAPALASRDDVTEAREILTQHNIDADFLFPSQLSLFAQGDTDQRRRLIELWQIAPPRYGTQLVTVQDRQQTSLQREEEAAEQRYLRMMADETSGVQEGRSQTAEPYMISGYSELVRPNGQTREISFGQDGKRGSWSNGFEYSRVTDPAYHSGLWGQPMEHQYGAFEAMREQAAMDREREDEEML